VLIALSDGWRDYLLNLAPDLPVVVVPNPIERDMAALADRPREIADRCTVLFVGSLIRRKGILDALRAVPLVRDQAPDVEFVFAGGAELDGEREEIAQARRTAEAVGGVHFPGIVTGQAKIDLFTRAGIFLLPSYNENLPIVVLEALAAGLPLVVTPVGALPEILTEGVNALFFEPGDVEGLAACVARLARDPALRARMGAANRDAFCRDYQPEAVLARIEALYNQLLERDSLA
jgi:glycosyltransferase involved in cell wall biosynthesis